MVGIGRAIMLFPCLHHILELILAALIQQRWKTGGPRDAIYTRFGSEWPRLLDEMPSILRASKEKVELVKPEDDITRDLQHRVTMKLAEMGQCAKPEEERGEEEEEEEGAVGGEEGETPTKITHGDYQEFVRLVSVFH